MVAAEFDRFLERSMREYAEEIARNLHVPVERARTKADVDVRMLLPDGLHSPAQHLFVIEAGDGSAIGELWLGLNDKLGVREAFGYDFWVRPDLRGRGLGRRAMELGVAAARELGASRLALNVFGDNERARHLYGSFGFAVTTVNMALEL